MRCSRFSVGLQTSDPTLKREQHTPVFELLPAAPALVCGTMEMTRSCAHSGAALERSSPHSTTLPRCSLGLGGRGASWSAVVEMPGPPGIGDTAVRG
ncbi:MAG: hypothetical protein V4662_26570 [Verrucomicrobiota bacterium]